MFPEHNPAPASDRCNVHKTSARGFEGEENNHFNFFSWVDSTVFRTVNSKDILLHVNKLYVAPFPSLTVVIRKYFHLGSKR